MITNIGNIDRIARIAVGLLLIAAAFGVYGSAYQSVWGWVGIIPLATGIFGTCPVYSLLGIKTSTAVKAS
jgi:hypothetical protein